MCGVLSRGSCLSPCALRVGVQSCRAVPRLRTVPPMPQPERLESWHGALAQRQRGTAAASVRALIRSYGDGSFASLVITDTRSRYWVKVIGNPQGDQVLVTETVVAGAGRLIGAPVRPTALLTIPLSLDGTQYGPTRRESWHAGVAHASLHLDGALEDDHILHPRRGSNPQRRARLLVLWEWCLGADAQWLYETSSSDAIWSFDHGFWLGGEGSDWDIPTLTRLVREPWPWADKTAGIDADEALRCASRLRTVTVEEILDVLAAVPVAWGVPDSDLEALGWFLYNRRSTVADRVGHAYSSRPTATGRG